MKSFKKELITCLNLEWNLQNPLALTNATLSKHNTDPPTSSSSSSDRDGPYINPLLSPNVVAVLGKEARLKCYVTSLGNKTVSFTDLTEECTGKELLE